VVESVDLRCWQAVPACGAGQDISAGDRRRNGRCVGPARPMPCFMPEHGSDDVTAPDGLNVPRWVCEVQKRGAVMSQIITVGIDLANNSLLTHGANTSVRAVLRRKLLQNLVLANLRQLSR